jgi:glutamate-1-semialdehyde 2,1-aminomutase
MSDIQSRLKKRYSASVELLARASQLIPSGSQTFSKSYAQYPVGVSPHFLVRGVGSRVWDVDGNEYVDFVNSLASVNLGHADDEVLTAVQEQLKAGVNFSLAHPVEYAVAQKVKEMVPCAEKVRFGKNGSDATAGAVRLARAYTGRDHVLVCGYHGWQDWYIGATARARGVPNCVRDLTHTFTYNDIESVERLFREYPKQVAAVILEPMNTTAPAVGFLGQLKELTHRNGALLIFDEMLTGFRFDAGGAQVHFGVTPDLATFGKGIANGFALSALVGRADIMSLMEDRSMEDVFFSLTYAGETLALAAALATMSKIQRQPVIETLYRQGTKVLEGAKELIRKHEVGHILGVCGNPTLIYMSFADAGGYSQWHVRTLFLQELFARGVLMIGVHNMSYSHGDAEVNCLLAAYDEVFPILREAVDGRRMSEFLQIPPLVPPFRVR